jgi:DNA-binding transcriptional LysR family regulator
MRIALPSEHELAGSGALELARLADQPWLCGTTNGSCRELTVRSCRQAGFDPDVSFESNDYNVIQSLVAAGLGVSLLPDLAFTAPHPGIEIVDVLPEPPVRRVWAATLQAGSRSGATEAMLDVLAEVSAGFVARAPAAA